MNSTEILEVFRETVSDEEIPYLWSDAEAYRFMNDAQRVFCRETGGLGDGSSVLTQLAYDGTTDWVTVSPLILKFRDATDNATGKEVTIVNYEDLRKHGLAFDGRTGPVRNLVIGIEAGRARLYPAPTEAGQINLIVDRLPLKQITDSDQKLEIADQHHEHLVLWMAHRAYNKQDAETMNNRKAAEFEARFKQYCFDAKAEKERAMHKTRVVSYGGI